MNISLIIVNYNTKELTKDCLKSVFEKTQGIDFEVYVVDNNSHDGSCEIIEQEFPQVKLIKNTENKGFGAANNIAIKESKAKYVFLLNSGTVLLNNAIKIFFDFMEKPENQKISCCGGNLYDENLTYGYSYGIFPTIKSVFFKRFYLDKFFKNYYKKKFTPGLYQPNNSITEVDFVSGANMFLRRSVLNEVGLFDEDFFLYYEETELTYRMYNKGYKSVIIPNAQIIHLHGASRETSSNIIKIARNSELMFFEKCYGKKQKFLVKLIQLFENLPRFLVKIMHFIQNLIKFGTKSDINNINILHLISSLEVGGAENLLIDLLKNTDPTNNIDFVVVVMNDRIDETLKKELLATNYNIYFLNRKQSDKNPKYLLQLLNIIKKHRICIIHSHNPGSKIWAILCKFLKPKIKLIFTVHSMGIFKNLSKFNLFLHKKFIDENIAISKAVLKDCYDFKIKKAVQIYNGIKVRDFLDKEKTQKNTNILNILNVSRINHVIKGQDILIKALKECKDKGLKFKCSLVGGIYDYGRDSFDYLKKLLKELDLEKEILFLGNRHDIPELLSQSDLFILPSRYEGLGLVVLEAMAARIPVISSNIDGPAELINHGENGLLFESENHFDLADKILYLYNNQEEMNQLAQNGFDFVKNFDISVMCKNYCELYKNLIKH